MHNTTWALNIMLSFQKLMSQFQKNFFVKGQTGSNSQDAFGQSQVSNKKMSQLRSIAVDNKNKTHYNSADYIFYPTNSVSL